jgi:hypothetical protein
MRGGGERLDVHGLKKVPIAAGAPAVAGGAASALFSDVRPNDFERQSTTVAPRGGQSPRQWR